MTENLTKIIKQNLSSAAVSGAVMILAIISFALSIYLLEDNKNFVKNSPPNLSVSFLDVGQGDSIYIETPTGNSMLIDSGPAGGKVLDQLSSTKNFFDKKIDVALITHTDADHIGSMSDLIKKYNLQLFVESGITSGTKIYDSIEDLIRNKSIPQIQLMRGMKIVLDTSTEHVESAYTVEKRPRVVFEVLFPSFIYQLDKYDTCMNAGQVSTSQNIRKKNFRVCKKFLKLETNENSIVGRLVFGGTTFMLTGDAPIEVEKYLVDQRGDSNNLFNKSRSTTIPVFATRSSSNTPLKSNVLKLGHHGSRTSTSDIFLEYVQPEFVVISSGLKNKYGHPHQEVLERLEKYFTPTASSAVSSCDSVLRTDTQGTITFQSDGSDLLLTTGH